MSTDLDVALAQRPLRISRSARPAVNAGGLEAAKEPAFGAASAEVHQAVGMGAAAVAESSVGSLAVGVLFLAVATAWVYWVPRSQRFINRREQRRGMAPWISQRRFEQLERANAVVMPLFGFVLTMLVLLKLLAVAF